MQSVQLIEIIAEKVKMIQGRLKAAQDRQKSYIDNRRTDLKFNACDRVVLKISPWKGVIRFQHQGKLGCRYSGLFQVIERIGPMAYRLE